MSGFRQRFVVDTNSLSQLGTRRRTNAFFLDNAVIPDEVLHEARRFPDIAVLRGLRCPTTPRVLRLLSEVMSTVPVDDTGLVDLYANRGNADPFVVACALDGQAEDSQYLDPPEWVVVTGDDAVRAKAEEFGLQVLTNPQFAAAIDAAEVHVGGGPHA